MYEFTYEELLWKQSGLAYTIQDLKNDIKIEKDENKLKIMQEDLTRFQKEFDEVCLMLDNGEFIKDDMWYGESSSDYDDNCVTNGEIASRIEACYDY
jgi:hypothetical protein